MVTSRAKRPIPASRAAEAASALESLPQELLVRVLIALASPDDLGRVDCVSSAFHHGHPSAVEQALRLRARARGEDVEAQLPAYESSWTQALCWRERRLGVTRNTVAASTFHSAFVDTQGQLLTCGKPARDDPEEDLPPGLLGHGEALRALRRPRAIASLSSVRVYGVAAGSYHTLALTESGAVFSFGSGALGKLGHGDEADALLPRRIDALQAARALSVAAGPAHSVVLTHDRRLLSFGGGGFGRLGLGDGHTRCTPKVIDALDGVSVAGVSCAQHHTLVTCTAGLVYSCGNGRAGRLGHGDTRSQLVPKAIEALRGRRVFAVAAGFQHSLVLVRSGGTGDVYSFGCGGHGQLGHGDEDDCLIPRMITALTGVCVVAVEAGEDRSFALTADGAVYSFGDGSCGELGHGSDADDEGELTPRRIDAPDLDAPVVTVSAGERQTLFALAGGAIRGCGMCEYGPRIDEVIRSPAPLHTSLRVATLPPLCTALA